MPVNAQGLYDRARAVVRGVSSLLASSRDRMAAGAYDYQSMQNDVANVNGAIDAIGELSTAINGADGDEFATWLNLTLVGSSKTQAAWQADVDALLSALVAFNTTIDGSISSLNSPAGWVQGEQWAFSAGVGTFTQRVFSAGATAGLRDDIDAILAAKAALVLD